MNSESLNIFGKRLVIQGDPDMSVQFSFLTYSLRNFICCKIHKALRHLTQAGIWNGYIDLFLAQYKLTFMKKFGRQIYSKYAFKLNSDIRTAKIFHGRSSREDGDENSLGALWIVLPWCSVVVSMATVVLVWEFASICKGVNLTGFRLGFMHLRVSAIQHINT